MNPLAILIKELKPQIIEKKIKITENKEPEKTEKVSELKNIEKVKTVEPIIKEKVEIDLKNEIVENKILPKEKTPIEKIEGTTQKNEKTNVNYFIFFKN